MIRSLSATDVAVSASSHHITSHHITYLYIGEEGLYPGLAGDGAAALVGLYAGLFIVRKTGQKTE